MSMSAPIALREGELRSLIAARLKYFVTNVDSGVDAHEGEDIVFNLERLLELAKLLPPNRHRK